MTAVPGVMAFIQARMSSERFPGKVLAPFEGRPLIAAVIHRVRSVIAEHNIVVATSNTPSDDPLALYAATLGVRVHRGSLDDVFDRFQTCLQANPCEWFYRVCADSPVLDPALLNRAASLRSGNVDIVTNVFPRTFGKGQSVELLRADAFAGIDARQLTPAQREHITSVYYQQPGRFRIHNFAAEDAAVHEDSAVDTVDDLKRLMLGNQSICS